jgi:hypothetical protein
MRKLLLVITSICIVTMLQAQVSKTVNVVTAGTLSELLTGKDLATVTNLTVTGSIDSLDFVTMNTMAQSALKVIDLSGAKCTRIPLNAFLFCSNLTSIIIPLTVTSIGIQAFDNCRALTSITIPSSVVSIENLAFELCSKLTAINIPASVTQIGYMAFSGIDTIHLDTNNKVFSFYEGVLFNVVKKTLIYCQPNLKGSYSIPPFIDTIEVGAFEDCCYLNTITIPSSVTTIKDWAFNSCKGLTSISIPATVKSIGYQVFTYCYSLQSIYAYSILPITLYSWDEFYCVSKSICHLYVPIGSLAAYQSANQWQDFTHIVEMGAMAFKEVPDEGIEIFPNPAHSSFSINNEDIAKLAIYDLNGNLVLNTTIQEKEPIPISKLTSGMYIVKILTGTTVVSKRLMVE